MKKRIKENMIFIIALALLLLLAGVGVYHQFAKTAAQKEPKSERTSSSTSSSSSAEEETTDEKNYRTAKLKLEHPYSDAKEDQTQAVASAFDEAVADIQKKSTLADVKGTLENHLSMTDDAMTQTFAMALLVNKYAYQNSKLEVHPSDSDDVVQFLIVLIKDNEESCYFVGNFNTTVNQIQLKAYVGGNIGGTFG